MGSWQAKQSWVRILEVMVNVGDMAWRSAAGVHAEAMRRTVPHHSLACGLSAYIANILRHLTILAAVGPGPGFAADFACDTGLCLGPTLCTGAGAAACPPAA